jgi:hypothetical protein
MLHARQRVKLDNLALFYVRADASGGETIDEVKLCSEREEE